MKKKEFYRRTLPHFQQPGQRYFVTWNLIDAVPPKALFRYTLKLNVLKLQIEQHEKQKSEKNVIEELKRNYGLTRRKYLKAYNDLLDHVNNPAVNLSKIKNIEIIREALHYWETKKLSNIAYCVMPNHVHWIFEVFEIDVNGQAVYLQDIMQSVKRQTANKINKFEHRSVSLWQHESFDTTIRDDKHLFRAITYTLQNPVSAGFTSDWRGWPGCWCRCADF